MSPPEQEAVTEQVRRGFDAHRIRLTPEQIEQFARYLGLLERWNRTHNLTAIRDRERAILRHFVEPAMARPLLAGAGPRLVDVGSGPGVPGLPLKILEPERECVLVDSAGKKATFLREVVDALELEDTTVLEGRLEELLQTDEVPAPVHILTARAWSGYGPMLGRMARVMSPGGRAVLLIGGQSMRELRRNLVQAGGPPKAQDAAWQWAVQAGWEVRRVMTLPHLEEGYAVSLELPSA